MHCWLVMNVAVQCLCNMPLFLLGFLAWKVAGDTLKAMKSISHTCECMHGVWDVDCEFVMVVGVGRDISVL